MLSKASLVAFVAVACYGLHRYLDNLGVNSKYYKHYPGNCRQVPGVEYGSEDIYITADGKAFVTSGLLLHRDPKEEAEGRKRVGKIFLFDFKNSSAPIVNLEIKTGKQVGFDLKKFRPHGLDVLEDKVKGEHLVYVVNHPVGLPDMIEKFRYSPKSRKLVYVKSIPAGEKLRMTNDLAVVSEDQFYITNFRTFPHSLRYTEALFPLARGGVFFYNGTDMQDVVLNMNMPNGIALSPDHRLLYVVSFLENTVEVYSLDPVTKGAKLVQTVWLHGRGDNLMHTPSGDALLVAVHPNFLDLVAHERSPTPRDILSPSSVVRMPLGKDNLIQKNELTELFYDHGDLISGSSTAAIFDAQMLIGSVVDTLVHCDLFTK